MWNAPSGSEWAAIRWAAGLYSPDQRPTFLENLILVEQLAGFLAQPFEEYGILACSTAPFGQAQLFRDFPQPAARQSEASERFPGCSARSLL